MALRFTAFVNAFPPHSNQASLTQLLVAFLENRGIAAIVNSGNADNIGWITLNDVTDTLMGARG